MQQVQSLLVTNPFATSINLDFENIRDLTLCIRTLQKFKYLNTLSLHGNQLKMLPLMSQLKLFSLDLTNNPISIDNYLLDSLFSIPTLQHLSIDVTQAESERILQNLPNLKTLNKKRVIRQKLVQKKNDLEQRMKVSLKQQKQKVKQIARNILQKFEYYEGETLTSFDNTFIQIFQQYRSFTQNVSIDTAKEGVFLYSKNRLVDILQQKVVNTLAQNKLQHIADAIQEIGILRKQHFESLLRIVLQVGYNQLCLQDDLGDQINTEMKNIKLRKQRLYLKQIMRLKKKINDYKTYLSKLEQENSKHIHTLYSLTRGDFQQVDKNKENKKTISKPFELFAPTRLLNRQKSTNKISSPTNKNANSRPNMTPSKSSQKLNNQNSLMPRKSLQKTKLSKQNSNAKVILGYDQTISLMEQFIQAKHAQNQKYKKKKQAYQTAQQYLSNYFTSKYGVKTIAINWGVNFIRSLQIYARQNSLCEAFLKILKNTIQQSFYEQHVTFIQNVKAEIEQLSEQENISQSDAENIFLHHFPTQDLNQFKLITNFGQHSSQVIFKQLCKTHVKIHQRLLSEFCQLFKVYDTDQDGSLTLQQAKQFVTSFFKPKIQKAIVTHSIIQKVIRKLDPYKKNKIIYSQLVDIIDKIN